MIISGGQTGVDRSALDFAIQKAMVCGGYCPLGRRAEDGTIDAKYPLKECLSRNYAERTELNIKESHGTLILTHNKMMDKGTLFTKKCCIKWNKPIFIADTGENPEIVKPMFYQWLEENAIEKLNIAGCRESFCPGIYHHAMNMLEFLL